MPRFIDNSQLEVAIRRAAWAWLRKRIADGAVNWRVDPCAAGAVAQAQRGAQSC